MRRQTIVLVGLLAVFLMFPGLPGNGGASHATTQGPPEQAGREYADGNLGVRIFLPGDGWRFLADKEKEEINRDAVAAFTSAAEGLYGFVAYEDMDVPLPEYNQLLLKAWPKIRVNRTTEVTLDGKAAFKNELSADVDGSEFLYESYTVAIGTRKWRAIMFGLKADFEKNARSRGEFFQGLRFQPGAMVEEPARTLVSDRWKFSVLLPKGWKGREFSAPDGIAVADFEGEGGNVAGQITVEEYAGSATTYVDEVVRNVKGDYRAKLLEKQEGVDEATATYSATVNGTPFIYYMRVVAAGGNKLRWIGWTFAEKFDTYKARFEEVARTLKAR